MNLDSPFHLGKYTIVCRYKNKKFIFSKYYSYNFTKTVHSLDDHFSWSSGFIICTIIYHIGVFRSAYCDHVENTFSQKAETHTMMQRHSYFT